MNLSLLQLMSACPFNPKRHKRLLRDPDWTAERKLDGDRRALIIGKQRNEIIGRRESVVSGKPVEKTDRVPHLRDVFMKGLAGTVLDGEILPPIGLPEISSEVTKFMGSLPARAVELQREFGLLRYHVFDCLFYKGTDLRKKKLSYRQKVAEDVTLDLMVRIRKVGGDRDTISFIERCPAMSPMTWCKEIWAQRGEGIMLKDLDGVYVSGKRPANNWLKVKLVQTFDVVIIGFEAAKEESVKKGELEKTKTKYAGQVGSIKVGAYDKGKLIEVGTASGFVDDVRRDMTKNPKKYLNRVVEVDCQIVTEKGHLRSPRFKKFRDDLDPKKQTIKKILAERDSFWSE